MCSGKNKRHFSAKTPNKIGTRTGGTTYMTTLLDMSEDLVLEVCKALEPDEL
jgi:hypothetical protein